MWLTTFRSSLPTMLNCKSHRLPFKGAFSPTVNKHVHKTSRISLRIRPTFLSCKIRNATSLYGDKLPPSSLTRPQTGGPPPAGCQWLIQRTLYRRSDDTPRCDQNDVLGIGFFIRSITVQWLSRATSPELRRQRREADHSRRSNALVMNEWSYNSTVQCEPDAATHCCSVRPWIIKRSLP